MFLRIRTEISKDDRALLFHRMIEALRRCGFPSHVSVTRSDCLLVDDGGRGAVEIMAALDGMAQHVQIVAPQNPNKPHKARRIVCRPKSRIKTARSMRAEGRSSWGPLKPYCANCARLRMYPRDGGQRYSCQLMERKWSLSVLQNKLYVARVQVCGGESFEPRRQMEILEGDS